MKEVKNVVAFVAVAFLLLGALFGMNIMSFMFGNLQKASIDAIPNPVITITNESGAFINETGYIVSNASLSTFLGGVTIIEAFNRTNAELITAANYTVNSGGNVTNASVTNWNNVSLTYSFSSKSGVRVAVEDSNNGSIQGIVSYSAGAGTQFSTVAIAITLIILIVLFLVFWKSFIAPMMKGAKSGSKGRNFA